MRESCNGRPGQPGLILYFRTVVCGGALRDSSPLHKRAHHATIPPISCARLCAIPGQLCGCGWVIFGPSRGAGRSTTASTTGSSDGRGFAESNRGPRGSRAAFHCLGHGHVEQFRHLASQRRHRGHRLDRNDHRVGCLRSAGNIAESEHGYGASGQQGRLRRSRTERRHA